MGQQMMCSDEDLELAIKIAEQGQTDISMSDEVEQEVERLYGEAPQTVEVPTELLVRLATEVRHHKMMMTSKDAGLVVTLGGSSTGEAMYGLYKDMRYEFRVRLYAPDAKEMTAVKLEEIVDCTIKAWRARLEDDATTLLGEVMHLNEQAKALNN